VQSSSNSSQRLKYHKICDDNDKIWLTSSHDRMLHNATKS
jgi:hypothetical protein